jgi:hypothetical protein
LITNTLLQNVVYRKHITLLVKQGKLLSVIQSNCILCYSRGYGDWFCVVYISNNVNINEHFDYRYFHIYADKLAVLEFMLEKGPRMISRSKNTRYWKPRHTSEPGSVRGAQICATLTRKYII